VVFDEAAHKLAVVRLLSAHSSVTVPAGFSLDKLGHRTVCTWDVHVNLGMVCRDVTVFSRYRFGVTSGSLSLCRDGIGVALGCSSRKKPMVHDLIVPLLLAVVGPVIALVAFFSVAKTKRRRRPVKNFR
jgi:hypothetical protein